MKLAMKIVCAFLWAVTQLAAAAELVHPPADKMATLLQCPSQRLRATDDLRSHRKPDGSPSEGSMGVTTATKYSLEGSKAFHLSIISSGPAGIFFNEWRENLLKDDENKLKETLRVLQIQRPETTERDVREARGGLAKRFRFGDGGVAAAGVVGFGPPGTLYAFSISHPATKQDVTVLWDIPTASDESLTEAEAGWVGSVTTNFAAMFLPLATELAAQLAGQPVSLTEVPWTANFAASAPASPTTNQSATKVFKPAAPPVAPDSAPNAPAAKRSASKTWLLLMGLASVAVIAWLLLKSRLR